jgi:hypothetical protein
MCSYGPDGNQLAEELQLLFNKATGSACRSQQSKTNHFTVNHLLMQGDAQKLEMFGSQIEDLRQGLDHNRNGQKIDFQKDGLDFEADLNVCTENAGTGEDIEELTEMKFSIGEFHVFRILFIA